MVFPTVIGFLLAVSIAVSTFAPSDETLRLAFDRGQRFYVIEDYEQAIEKFAIVKDVEDSRLVDETRVLIRVGDVEFPVKVAATFQMANACRNLAGVRLEEAAQQTDMAEAERLRAEARELFGRAASLYQEASRFSDLIEIQVLSSYQLVKTEFQAGNYEGVIRSGEALIAKFPQSDYVDEALYEMGWAHFNLGHYEAAIESFGRLSGRVTADYRIDRAEFQIGQSYSELGRHGEAREILGRLVAKYDFSHLTEAERVRMEAEKLTGVVKETALELAAKAQILIGDTYREEGDLDAAVAAYNRLILQYGQKQELAEDAYVKIGEVYFGQGDLEGGVRTYRRAMNEVPARDFRARMQARIARSYYEAGRFARAREEYEVFIGGYSDVAQRSGLDLDRARFLVAQCLFELAEERRALGDSVAATDIYQQAKGAYLRVPDDYRGTPLRAESLLGAGLAAQRRGAEADLVEALALFSRVGDEHPDRHDLVARARLQLARLHYTRGAYADAAESYRTYLMDYPEAREGPQAMLELGLTYRDAGRYDDAVAAVEAIPADSDLWVKAGLVAGELLLRQGHLERAVADLERGLAATETPEAAGDLHYVLARVLFELGRHAAAAEAFTEAMAVSDKTAILHGSLLGRGTARFQLGDHEAAVRDLEQLLAAEPPLNMKDQAHRLLGQAYVRMGRRAEAIKDYEAIIEAARDPRERAEFTLLLAELYYGLGRYEDAIEQARQVMGSQFADSAEERGYLLQERAYFVTGDAYNQRGDHQQARRVFADALKEFPRGNLRPDLVFGEAVAAFALEDYGLVVSHLQEFVSKYGDSPNLENAHYFLAYSHLRQADFAEAATWFGRLADRFPDSDVAAEALFQQGECLFNLRRYGEAADTYRRILDAYPASAFADNAIYNLGWSQFELGQTDDALAQFRALLDRFPQSQFAASAQFTLGDYFFNAKEYARATEAYAAVVANYPDAEMAQDARGLLDELGEIQAYLDYEGAMSHFDAGDFGAAAEALARVVETYPETPSSAGALANLGMSYEYQHRWKDAASAYEKLVAAYGDQTESSAAVAFAREHLSWIVTNRL